MLLSLLKPVQTLRNQPVTILSFYDGHIGDCIALLPEYSCCAQESSCTVLSAWQPSACLIRLHTQVCDTITDVRHAAL